MNQGLGLDPVPGLAKLKPDTTYLKVNNGPGKNQEIALNQMDIILGRNAPPDFTVDIDLSQYELGTPPMCSRRQALLQWVNGELQLCDLNSRNGTSINGEKLTPKSPDQPSDFVTLKRGDLITFGNIEMEVIVHE